MGEKEEKKDIPHSKDGRWLVGVVSISVNVSGGRWAGKGQYKRNSCCEVRSCKSISIKFTRIHPP